MLGFLKVPEVLVYLLGSLRVPQVLVQLLGSPNSAVSSGLWVSLGSAVYAWFSQGSLGSSVCAGVSWGSLGFTVSVGVPRFYRVFWVLQLLRLLGFFRIPQVIVYLLGSLGSAVFCWGSTGSTVSAGFFQGFPVLVYLLG